MAPVGLSKWPVTEIEFGLAPTTLGEWTGPEAELIP